MNIFKAFIFTLLLIAIETVLVVGCLSLDTFLNLDTNEMVHYNQIVNFGTKLLVYLVMLLFIFKLRFNKDICLDSFSRIEWKTIIYIVITVIGCKLSFKPLIDIKLIIETIKDNYIEVVSDINEEYRYLLIYKFISAVIIAPIIEELFFRKVIFRELQKKYSLVIAIIVSSLCFGLIHLNFWTGAVTSVVFGVFSCLIYTKTKNILYPILFHFASNLATWIIVTFNNGIFTFHYESSNNWLYWTTFILGISVTIFGLRKITTANKTLMECDKWLLQRLQQFLGARQIVEPVEYAQWGFARTLFLNALLHIATRYVQSPFESKISMNIFANDYLCYEFLVKSGF